MTAQMTLQPINLIAIDPSIRNGKPHIVGTTLTVIDVAIAYTYHLSSANEIAEEYDLSLAQAHSALAYYFDNKQTIDEQVRAHIRKSERLKAQRFGQRMTSRLSAYAETAV